MATSMINGHCDPDTDTYKAKCPFCNTEHEQRLYLNTICHQCGAKFYAMKINDHTPGWLNRATGEWRH